MKSYEICKKKNLRFKKTSDGFLYKYYDTQIVTVRNRTLVIRTGGYWTRSTKRHINDICVLHGMEFSMFRLNKVQKYRYQGITENWPLDEKGRLKDVLVLEGCCFLPEEKK